ncbi:MAG: Bro-N domain-containing protein [Clostridium fessum]
MTDFNQKTHDTDVGSHGGQSRQMMEVFENQEFGSIRVLQEAGKTFFCASDVAKALGYVNPYAAVKRHCRGPLTKREGVVQKVNQYGDAGEQVVEIAFITEGDVYRLIVHSKLPSAERFEHWVFDEVLPSIRKHGVYGRMVEIYLMVSLAPIPFATFGNHEQSHTGQNYLRSLFALGFQGFLIMICVGIYAVLIQNLSFSDNIISSIWGVMGYTVLLAFTLFKTGSLAKSVFAAH